jgi:predicted DNA-binding WGR domain protein/cell wall assembly regulator SMI1
LGRLAPGLPSKLPTPRKVPRMASKRRFELVDGSSSKFWEVSVSGATVSVCFGRIGSAGSAKDKTHASPAEAQREAAKLVAEKTRKGYVEAAKAAPAPSKKPSAPKPAAATRAPSAAKNGDAKKQPVAATKTPALVQDALDAVRKKHKAIYGDLRPPASPADLKRLSALGVPPNFVALYATHDGVEGEEFLAELGLLPIELIFSERKMMNDLLAENREWRAREWWNDRWVPFLGDRAGQLVCFDPVGALEGGKAGQLIFFDHEEGPRIELPSFDVFLGLVAALAKKGVLVDRDHEKFAELYEDAQSVGAEKMPAKERKKVLAKASDLESERGGEQPIIDLVLPLARRYAADQELWNAVANAAEYLGQWELAAEAAANVVRLERPGERYTYCATLVRALHELGRDEEALSELGKVLKRATSEAQGTLAIPGHNQRYEYAAKPDSAAFQLKCLRLWTELQPEHFDAWWQLQEHSKDGEERKRCWEKTLELCTPRRVATSSWVGDRRKAALKLLGRKK